MIDVVALGELLIDFTPAGMSEQGAVLFARNAGGAPANVLSMLSVLNKRTAFIGKVGRDGFGDFLKRALMDNGIDVSNLIESDREPTTLAFVELDGEGERSFTFYRRNSADVMLNREEISLQLLEECRLFHFGSVSMTDQPARDATLYAAQEAKALGKLVSYDPNFRPALWEDREKAARIMRSGLKYADIVKASDDEMKLLTGKDDYLEGAKALVAEGAKLGLVTAGNRGTWYASASGCGGHIPAFRVETVDTTGAGDTFLGALLSCVLDRAEPLETLGEEELRSILRFANAAGALCTTGMGAIASMPTREQIDKCLRSEEL